MPPVPDDPQRPGVARPRVQPTGHRHGDDGIGGALHQDERTQGDSRDDDDRPLRADVQDEAHPPAPVAPLATEALGPDAVVVPAPRARPDLVIMVDAWHPVLPRSEAGQFHAASYTLAASASPRVPRDGAWLAAGSREPSPLTWVTLPERWRAAAPARIASFVAGRHCAGAALARAGAQEIPRAGPLGGVTAGVSTPAPEAAHDTTLGVMDSGAPRWPAGFVGSISHTADRAIAVTASDRRLRAIGIDCERRMNAATADDVANRIVPELDVLLADAGLADRNLRPTVITLVFSAKESLYKALHPLVDEFFDFTDVRAERLDMTSQTLDLRLLRPLGPGPSTRHAGTSFDAGASFSARFALMATEIVTLVELPVV